VERSRVTIGGAVLHREVIPQLWKAGKQMRTLYPRLMAFLF
jgi:hypothetical protein